ncbi:MAG TPA: Asp-tRNA(Asn)/Glu-tRNA(Gln) amidotransferase subunit GatB [Candidatus Paceibacterota bacterium]
MVSPSGKWYPRIGLEIHAELNTHSKCFCACKNDPDETRPNVNVCPVCMGYPGALPVLNKEAVKSVLKLGVALGSKIADFTEWDRKNYFYPDIPKGYQISQYKHPLITGGELEGVKITRVHLEEDTARSQHDKGEGSIVDFNRSGVPLMELVTEPVITSAEQAGNFARSLQTLLQYLGIAEANMEKGEMRVEANISVSNDPKKFGTKAEVKNLNSFKSVEKAIAFELKRHQEAILRGEKVIQETRGFDEAKGATFSQRSKEEAEDYRYFPDPDLPKLYISEIPDFDLKKMKKELPELPKEREERYKKLGLNAETARQLVLDIKLGNYFNRLLDKRKDEKFAVLASNYLVSDFQALAKENENIWTIIPPFQFFGVIEMILDGVLNSRNAKDTLVFMSKSKLNMSAKEIVEKENLAQTTNEGFVKNIVLEVIKENEKTVAEFKGGKENALQYLIGQGMKKSKGKTNPEQLKEILKKQLATSN